eukprot:TRINITY_DN3639_c0_g1_i2.p1 TRINITY_DN3639_c0_g1~~TRINITY_DN3639_c0_g1_i2.p1  ORF type:complete len:211 (+),score=51.65 TRINITY_DN3639_c0_g1_i2:87-635(+)
MMEGAYYFEVEVLDPAKPLPYENVEAHVRIGVATRKADLEMPIGADKFGYSYRDAGSAFFNGKGKSYGVNYKPGDVVGVFINLMPLKPPNLLERKRKGAGDASQVISNGSFIEFYVNGKSQGIAFNDIYEGEYYAGVALYMHGRVRFNFGPDFAKKPAGCKPYKPYKDVVLQKLYKAKYSHP